MDKAAVSCEECRYVCSARVAEDGRIVLPTREQKCPDCGHEAFGLLQASDD